MRPILFSFDGLEIYSFGVLLLLGFLLGLFVLRYLAVRYELNFSFIRRSLLGLVLVALIGARVFDAIFTGQYLPWSGGLALNGAVIASLFYFRQPAQGVRQNLRAWLDIITVAALFAAVLGYLGYFLQGRGLGAVTGISWLSWSVIERIDFSNSGLPVLPLALIMMLVCLVLAGALLLLLQRVQRKGVVFCLGWTGYYLAVWLTEGMRASDDITYYLGELNVTRWVAAMFFILGLAWLLFSVVSLEVAKKRRRHGKV